MNIARLNVILESSINIAVLISFSSCISTKPTTYTESYFQDLWARTRYVPAEYQEVFGEYRLIRGSSITTLTLHQDSTYQFYDGGLEDVIGSGTWVGRYSISEEKLIFVDALHIGHENWDSVGLVEYRYTPEGIHETKQFLSQRSPSYFFGNVAELYIITQEQYDKLKWDPSHLVMFRGTREINGLKGGSNALLR